MSDPAHDFDRLRVYRQALQDAVLVHRDSVCQFADPTEPWFRKTLRDQADPPSEKDKRPRHLSTTASCLESLADVSPATESLPSERLAQLAADFAGEALDADPEEELPWSSEAAAHIYCRVRTLPAVLRFGENTDARLATAQTLLEQVWNQVDVTDEDRQGVAETNPLLSDALAPRYPPNGFHTYWAIRALDCHSSVGGELDVGHRRHVARLWARKELNEQTALLVSGAGDADAQQMIWAMLADHAMAVEDFTAASPRHAVYRAAIDAFFDAQSDAGTWQRSRPLFHYPNAGNAYCYPYETLTELLRPALGREHGRAFRVLLRPHLDKLVLAWRYAERTRIKLAEMGEAQPLYGWSSGHHPHRREPEAWATASVYSFLQLLRCLVGEWSAEAAAARVRARPSKFSVKQSGLKMLAERGDTWVPAEKPTIARRLASLFVNPRSASRPDPRVVDPDTQLIDHDDARSAILFGPPGTSKTTLVESVAAAIGWRFVEIQAAEFLRDGMDKVPARADAIFAALMELDRCVILFDEIDELIRERADHETDPFGRFLTTSMLPKIAQLWEQRRVLFFVATNHIDKADPAIRRSQRFDAAMLVMPPAYHRKRARLEQLGVSAFPPALERGEIDKLLASEDNKLVGNPLGVFALIRWDQLEELAVRLDGRTELDAWREVLLVMGQQLQRVEWHDRDANRDPYGMYREYSQLDRQDFGKRQMVWFCGENGPPDEGRHGSPISGDSGSYWDVPQWETLFGLQDDGQLSAVCDGWSGLDDYVLTFRADGEQGPIASEPTEPPTAEDVLPG